MSKARRFTVVLALLVLLITFVSLPAHSGGTAESTFGTSCTRYLGGQGDLWDAIWCHGIAYMTIFAQPEIVVW